MTLGDLSGHWSQDCGARDMLRNGASFCVGTEEDELSAEKERTKEYFWRKTTPKTVVGSTGNSKALRVTTRKGLITHLILLVPRPTLVPSPPIKWCSPPKLYHYCHGAHLLRRVMPARPARKTHS